MTLFWSDLLLQNNESKLSYRSQPGKDNPMFGRSRTGELGGTFKGIIIGTNADGETVAFNGEKSIDSRRIKLTGLNFDSSKVYRVLNGRANTHAGFKFLLSKEVSVLKHRLATAKFYDKESREAIQNYLETCENTTKERK